MKLKCKDCGNRKHFNALVVCHVNVNVENDSIVYTSMPETTGREYDYMCRECDSKNVEKER